MKKVIYKYQLKTFTAYLDVPKGGKILCFMYQHSAPTFWAQVDPDEKETEKYLVHIIPSGNPFDDEAVGQYIGTVEQPKVQVWHMFAKKLDKE